ncbi:hypothetical protein [Alcaligenes sp. SDU_A2]|uniref:hypothetical protein n=1 Tax=Alcaligenes sp. SDU_A2 TaxID=3136634 RepID=UPI00311E71F7
MSTDTQNSAPVSAEPVAVPDAILLMAQRIAADDFEHCTSDPIFTVEKRNLITGLDLDYTDNIGWFCEGEQIDDEDAAVLEAAYQESGNVPDNYTRTGIEETWEHFATYVTLEAAREFVSKKGDQYRVYVDSGCRNHEWKALRAFLLQIAANPVLAAPVAAQAQQSAISADWRFVEARECSSCGHVGINDSSSDNAACSECDWIGPMPETDRCQGCERESVMTAACPKCGDRYNLLASSTTQAPAQQPVSGADRLSIELRGIAEAASTRPIAVAGFIAAAGHCENCDAAKGHVEGNADTERLNLLQDNYWDLRCISVRSGGDDADVDWIVIGHHMAKPHERVIGRAFKDDPRAAIDAARKEQA